jgi:hypothetical protein
VGDGAEVTGGIAQLPFPDELLEAVAPAQPSFWSALGDRESTLNIFGVCDLDTFLSGSGVGNGDPDLRMYCVPAFAALVVVEVSVGVTFVVDRLYWVSIWAMDAVKTNLLHDLHLLMSFFFIGFIVRILIISNWFCCGFEVEQNRLVPPGKDRIP